MLRPEVKLAIETNYDEFFRLRKTNIKLQFVKLLKDLSGIGLKEAKDEMDFIWGWDNIVEYPVTSVPRFEREFSLKTQRKDKLENLKKRLFAKEIASIIKQKTEEEVIEDIMTMTSDEMENLLKCFYNE